jgi:hypothetical protein
MPQTTQAGPNLTNVASVGRQFIKIGGAAIILMIVGRTLFTAFNNYWTASHPPAPPPPTVGFGKLPSIEFPTQLAEDKPTAYRLETATGTTPNFGDRAKVFLKIKSAPSLLDDEKARNVAADLGFVFQPEVLDSRTYRWSKSQPLEATLEVDSQNLDINLTTDYLNRPELVANPEITGESVAVARVRALLSKVELLPGDVATSPATTKLLKLTGGELQPAVALSEAQFIEVDINRNPIDNIPMYTPQGQTGLIHAIVSGGLRNNDSVVDLQSRHQTIDYSQVHTYPLRTSQDAWRLLQAGEGFIVNKGTTNQAVIREVTLGYYDAFEEQDYLQPVYVFSGDGGFLGYVPAISPQLIQTPVTP